VDGQRKPKLGTLAQGAFHSDFAPVYDLFPLSVLENLEKLQIFTHFT
jgi:hypothetical protein